jgi:hypothetical protein
MGDKLPGGVSDADVLMLLRTKMDFREGLTRAIIIATNEMRQAL